MKVAFIFHRANHLKLFGPIIDAALERNWAVECWLEDVPLGDKEYLRVTPELISAHWGDRVGVRLFQRNEDVAALNAAMRADMVVSIFPRKKYMEQPGQECFVTLQYNVDTFAIATYEQHASSDYLCLYTPAWWEYATQYYSRRMNVDVSEIEARLANKVVYTGFPQMDIFGRIDRDKVRTRWGIPEDKKVVLVLSLDLAGWAGAWPVFFQGVGLSQWRLLWRGRKEKGFLKTYWKWALKGWNDEKLADAIKQFANCNNAVVLVKGREKDPIRKAWSDRSFRTFYDESHYPATVHEAIAIADLCIVFYSTAVQEAAYAGVPALCIDRPNRESIKHQLWRRATVGGPYNFPGIVEWKSIPDSIQQLPNMRLPDFAVDEQARRQYLELYNGPADDHASQRILDLVKHEA